MNKDTVTASIIGFGLGLIAAIALWVVPRILPKNPPPASPSTQVIGTTDAAPSPETSKISLTSPADGQIVTSGTIDVAGIAQGTSYVVVTTPQTNQVIKPDQESRFVVPLDLIEGGNQIHVTAYLENQVTTIPVTVFFQTEEQ